MGRATIVEVIGEGLYRAIPLWDFTRINLELLNLQAQQDQYWAVLNRALGAKRLLDDDVAIARAALDAVVEQWKQALIDKLKTTQPAPPPVPNDPQTGQPWVDPDRAQDQPLLDAINAARATGGVEAVTMNDVLSRAALAYAKYQGYTGRTGHLDSAGRGPEFRVGVLGYGYTAVGELLAYGEATIAAVVAGWLRDAAEKATLLGAGFTQFGGAYCHAGGHFSGHIWVVLLATPGPPSGTVKEPKPDPATKKATEAEAELEKITIPKLDNLSPDQLGKAAQNYGIAIAKLREADREIARLKTEELARDKRITLLESIKNTPQPMDVWCVGYDDSWPVGAVVDSMEIPGFWKDAGTPRTTDLYNKTPEKRRTVSWVERSWNLSIHGLTEGNTGQLTPAESLPDAAVFVNAALEPGHLKWRPYWRYGVITATDGVLATVSFSEENSRPMEDEEPMSLQRFYHYSGIPFRYPPCGGGIFEVGDEVFVLFEGTDRNQPVIIGFRREPKTCSGRQSWRQSF